MNSRIIALVAVLLSGAFYAHALTIKNIDAPPLNKCFGDCKGTAEVTAIQGCGSTPQYTYLWSDGQTTQTATGLCAGTYNVSVSDGCNTVVGSVVITQPSPSVVTIIVDNDATCYGRCDGQASVTSGGTFFLWDDLSSQVTSTATGLCAGIYTVLVTDGKGC
ncbi:MAG TPA: hypothetical protein EYN41_08310, partial [Flavobacteriales bacterium]|nr:hypothetical protein [Flavobacteriales bacterium]